MPTLLSFTPLSVLPLKIPLLTTWTVVSAESAVLPSTTPVCVLSMLTVPESFSSLMPFSAPLIFPAFFISPPILTMLIPSAPVEFISAFWLLLSVILCPPVWISMPSPEPVICPLLLILTTSAPRTETEGPVVEGEIMTPSVMMYLSSSSKAKALVVDPLIVVSADTIGGVNTINADKAGKIAFNDFVVLFNCGVLFFMFTSIL
ncbi:hypothetical protein QOY93_05830 [Leclercia adecarboxylata]|uniref:hypothetical protein n=1 Tax=Leclercia TaxID=83654 RepID=UPI001E35FC1F|nr:MULTISPECIES: hypothetical protein [Leclercia]MDK4744888.1 hypothetical protein [Leclercia adecarboxylata]UGB03148.1 hypothetical protein LRS40_03450 [Leclercia sp. G3L]